VAIINSVIFSSLFSLLLGSLPFSQKEAFLSKLFKIKVLKWTKLGHQNIFLDNDVDDVVGGLRGRGEFRVLACADTGGETLLGVRQYLLNIG
jgi:hypothetical protein